MPQMIAPQPGILKIDLYHGGAAALPGQADVVKLSSNENPAGPPASAVAAIREAAGALHLYPSTDHADLRAAIGRVHGLDPDRIVCGAGSDEVITFLCQAYAGPGDEVLHTEHGFLMYPISTLAAGAAPVAAPERARVTDVDALLAAVTERTSLVFVANPNNPTGTMIGMAELTRLADGLPDDVILVLDGAYAEFADGYDGGAALATERPNVVMTRTFSKLYGLGGLRLGWGYGPREVIDVLNRVRGPFNLGAAQIAGGIAAVGDRAFAAASFADNVRNRTWLAAALADLGVPSDASHANFLLARFESPAAALACDAVLRRHGLLVRQVAGYGLPDCLRITVGDAAACARVAAAVAAFRAEAA